MSGKLVGEVIAAAEELRARGVTQRGFMALVAIAEKADTRTRRASVRWDHLRAGLYGASKRTAERAVRELRNAGVLALALPGFNNNHGRSCAPVYEIAALGDTDTQVSESLDTDTDTQVSSSPSTDTDTQVSESVGGDTDKSGTDTDKSGGRYRHPGVVLDVPIDVPIDVKRVGASANPPKAGSRLPEGWEPPPAVIAEMRSERPDVDIDLELRKFRDYWMDQPGAKGRKTLWVGTFRNWIRNARPTKGTGRSAFEDKTAHNRAVFDALADDAAPAVKPARSNSRRELDR